MALGEETKVAHYYYGKWPNRTEIQVHASNRVIFVRDGQDINRLIHDPVWGKPYPFAGSGDCENCDPDGIEFSYETLGLYYGLSMPGTGWDGDC